jgi:cell division protein FtsZ
MHEVNEAAKVITGSADPDAKVIFGAIINEDLGDDIKMTVVATGFEKGKKPGEGFGSTVSYKPSKFVSRRQEEKDEEESEDDDKPRVFSRKKIDDKPSDDELDIPAFIRKKMK